MVRSGSTWSFNVAANLLRACDPDRRVFGFYQENPAVLASATRQRRSHLVIKSHVLDPSSYEFCRTGAIKTVYTWRSPYDVVVSSIRMFGSTAEHWIGVVRAALKTWRFHRATSSAHIVSYEAIVRNPCSEITGIAAYLGLSTEPEDERNIARALSFKQLRRFSQHIAELEPGRVVRDNGYLFDRRTLLHANHIRNGSMGYGVKNLNDSQLLAIDAMLCEEGFAFLREPHRAAFLSRGRTYYATRYST
jgi:hypothetical protein